MKIELAPGKYVVAVSGGVDSMVLLDILAKQTKSQDLIVAHFDHGIREDSHLDREFVKAAAGKYGLEFENKQGKLGPQASEETAREARYKFLKAARKKYGADAIITAHHQDDVLETAVINVLRGTSHKGLTALKSTDEIKRPLLGFRKKMLKRYAEKNCLQWREDPTNRDSKYLRNYVRHEILSQMSESQKQRLLDIIDSARGTDAELDKTIGELIAGSPEIDPGLLRRLRHNVGLEVLAHFLRTHQIAFDSKTLQRLSVGLKTRPPGSRLDISGGWHFLISKEQISLRKAK